MKRTHVSKCDRSRNSGYWRAHTLLYGDETIAQCEMHQRWRCVTPKRVTPSANSFTGSLWPMACWLCFFSVNGDKCCFGEQIVQHCVVYDEIKVIFVCKLKNWKIKCHSVMRVGCLVGPYRVSPLTGSTKPPRNQLYSLHLWLSYHVACRLQEGFAQRYKICTRLVWGEKKRKFCGTTLFSSSWADAEGLEPR